MSVKRKPTPAPTAPGDDFSGDVAGAWAALSPFKDETAIAVKRFRELYGRGLDAAALYYAIATFAAQAHDARHPHAPYHAIGFTEGVARSFIARINEIMREIERHDQHEGSPRRSSHLKPIGDVLAALGARRVGA